MHGTGTAGDYRRFLRGLSWPERTCAYFGPCSPADVDFGGGAKAVGYGRGDDRFFDTLTVRVPGQAARVHARALERRINLRIVDGDRMKHFPG